MAWLGKRVCPSKCEERDPAKLPPDSYTPEERTPKPDGALGSPAPPWQAPQFPRRLLPQGSTLSPVSPLLYGEETPEAAKRDKGLGENNRNKSQSLPWRRFPTQSSLRAYRGTSRPGQAAFSGGGEHVDRLGQACFQEETLPRKATHVCAPQQWGWGGVGSGGGAGGRGRPRGGVGKAEVLHQAWALEAEASRARRPNTDSKQALSLSSVAAPYVSHTHSLQDSGGLFHLPIQTSGLSGLELPSSDESSQSSSLLCVTQSRGPGNWSAGHAWSGEPAGGLCPPGPAVPPLEPQKWRSQEEGVAGSRWPG